MLKAAEEEHLAKEIDSSNPPERAWDAKKVDEDSFVKDGVAQAVGLVQSHVNLYSTDGI